MQPNPDPFSPTKRTMSSSKQSSKANQERSVPSSNHASTNEGVRILVRDGVYIKPKRVLTPYNFFFQDERRKMLQERQEQQQQDSFSAANNASKKGVGFAAMARTVSARWKVIGEATRQHYLERSAQDKIRYTREMQAWRKLEQEVNQVVMHQLQSVLSRQEGEEGSDSSSNIMIKMCDTSNHGRRGKSKKSTKKNKKQKKNKKREPRELERGENKKHKASKQAKENRNSSFSDEGKTYTPEAGTVQDTRRRTSTTSDDQQIMEFSDSISAPAAFNGASFCLRSVKTASDGAPTMPRPLLVHSVAAVAAPRPRPPTLTEILDRTQEIVASFHEAEIKFLRSLAGFSPQQKSPSTCTATATPSCSCSMTTMMKNCGHQNYNEEESPPPRAFLPMTPAPEDNKRHMPATGKNKNSNMLVCEDEDELFSESELAMVATTTTSSSSSVLLDDASSLLWDGEQSSTPSVTTSSPIRSMAKFSSSNGDERYITGAFNGIDSETSRQQNLDMCWNKDTTRLLNRNNTPRIVQRGSQEQNERDARPSFNYNYYCHADFNAQSF